VFKEAAYCWVVFNEDWIDAVMFWVAPLTTVATCWLTDWAVAWALDKRLLSGAKAVLKIPDSKTLI